MIGAEASGVSIDDNEELSYTATEDAMYYFRVALHNDMGIEEGNMYTLDVTFSGELDFPEGQEPNEPDREEDDTEENITDETSEDQFQELDPNPEKSGCNTNSQGPRSILLAFFALGLAVRRK